MLTVKNNMPQVLHTTGMRGGEVATLVIPPNSTTTCDATTPLLDTHARSRMVTISGTASLPPATVPEAPTPPAASLTPASTDASTSGEEPQTPTTSGGTREAKKRT